MAFFYELDFTNLVFINLELVFRPLLLVMIHVYILYTELHGELTSPSLLQRERYNVSKH